MFNPTREQVREMFFETWRKYRAGTPIAGIETIALDVILAHPEYHAALEDPQRTRERDYVDESNPFLHMSLHLALEEQLSIDQPPGIAARFESLGLKFGDRHAALDDPERTRERDYVDESNPFLHMSLHLALEEQLSIDQPPGIVARFDSLVLKHKNRHDAMHDALECLAETVWRAQRDSAPPDAAAYLECLAVRALRK